MEERTLADISALDTFAADVLAQLRNARVATVVTLSGELGAGKTAFVQALGRVLDVRDALTSPTFVLMRTYPLHDARFDTLVHIDAYRVEDPAEFTVLGFDTLVKTPRTLVVIEWPERIAALLPRDRFQIGFTAHADGTRTVTYGYA